MNRSETPSKATPACTVFRFSEAEVIEALSIYLVRLDEDVPAGSSVVNARYRDARHDEHFLTLRVTHSSQEGENS